MLIWAMVADCLDYSEWKLHIRSDGGIYNLDQKLCNQMYADLARLHNQYQGRPAAKRRRSILTDDD